MDFEFNQSEVFDYVTWFQENLCGGGSVGSSAIRIGLQMIEISIVRIEGGIHIDDFMGDESPSSKITLLKKAYKAYNEKTEGKKEILLQLGVFKEMYVRCFVDRGAFEDFIRATGVAEAKERMINTH